MRSGVTTFIPAVGPADVAPAPWREPGRFWPTLDTATAGLGSPLAVLELSAEPHGWVRRNVLPYLASVPPGFVSEELPRTAVARQVAAQ